MTTLACPEAPVKSEAQVYANLPTRLGGYRIWPWSQRDTIQQALIERLRSKGIGRKRARQIAYRTLRLHWYQSLSPDERWAYRADSRRAQTIPTHAQRMAFWAQPEGGAK